MSNSHRSSSSLIAVKSKEYIHLHTIFSELIQEGRVCVIIREGLGDVEELLPLGHFQMTPASRQDL